MWLNLIESTVRRPVEARRFSHEVSETEESRVSTQQSPRWWNELCTLTTDKLALLLVGVSNPQL